MKYRVLGKTGVRVSEIGFGCGNIGGLIVRGSETEQVEAVSHALKLGINYFDTAPAYGNGKSETNLGVVLNQLRPDVTLATKVGIASDQVKDFKGAVQSSLEASLRRLGRERVDLLQLHTPVTPERGDGGGRWSVSARDVLGRKGIADAFESIRSQGLVRFLGFTGLGDAAALHDLVKSDRFDTVQCYYNLLNPTAGTTAPQGYTGQDFGKLIDLAKAQNMGVVVIRVMAGGALGGAEARTGYASPTVGGALAAGAAYEDDQTRASKLDFLMAGDIKSLPQAAVTFALMHRGVSAVLVGFSNIAQVDEAVACSGKRPIPRQSLERLRKLWSADFRS